MGKRAEENGRESLLLWKNGLCYLSFSHLDLRLPLCACLLFQNESVTAMKKARQQYCQRCEELEKAKAISAKTVEDTATFKTLDKRRKSKDEAQAKVTALECVTLVWPGAMGSYFQ